MWRSSFNWVRSSWIVRKLTNGKYESSASTVRQNTSPDDSNVYVIRVQDILSWRSKTRTSISLIVTYIAVWFLYWMTTRPYYILSLCILANLARDAWLNYLWPEMVLPGRQSPLQLPKLKFEWGEELGCHVHTISNNLVHLVYWILQLRSNNSCMFCVILSAVWLGVAGMGSIFSGLVWAHLLFATAWATQLGLNIPTFILFSKDSRFQADMEDLIPQLSDDEIQVLEKAKDATYQSESILGEETFHLSTVPAPDDLDGETTINAGELNFVSSHFDGDEDDLEDFVPMRTKLNTKSSDIGNSATSDSANEDFEVISDSDLEM